MTILRVTRRKFVAALGSAAAGYLAAVKMFSLPLSLFNN
jgi:hypothetical protein